MKGLSAIANGIGLWGESDSTAGTNNGVFGEIFSSTAAATGVLGVSNAGSGTTYGVRGINSSLGQFAAGVEGENFATSGQTFGLVGSVSSPNGTGAVGLSDGESTTGFHLIGCCLPVSGAILVLACSERQLWREQPTTRGPSISKTAAPTYLPPTCSRTPSVSSPFRQATRARSLPASASAPSTRRDINGNGTLTGATRTNSYRDLRLFVVTGGTISLLLW